MTISTLVVLSAVRLIHSGLFAKMSPSEQTALLNTDPSKRVLFVPTFAALADKKVLAQKLLRGDDVSVELEYNKIELSEEELRAVKAVRPILERINGLPTNYPWLPVGAAEYKIVFNLASVRRNGYSLSHKHVKDVWDKASAYWGGHRDQPTPYTITSAAGYHGREVTITSTHVRIGCQIITRRDVEAIARKLELEPNINA